jgi:hypothetical protein
MARISLQAVLPRSRSNAEMGPASAGVAAPARWLQVEESAALFIVSGYAIVRKRDSTQSVGSNPLRHLRKHSRIA